MAASPSSRRKRNDWLHFGSGKSYAHRVHRPLQCLVFISPLLVFYQIASALQSGAAAASGESSHPLLAFTLLLKFFRFFGAAGNVLPLAAVVAILLFWHLARKDPWDFEPKLYGGMALESLLWGIPFYVIGLALARQGFGPAAATSTLSAAGARPPWSAEVILSIGAGIYEELIFRLITITTLSILLVDVLEMPLAWAIPIIIISSALLFSAYHYMGSEPFDIGSFAFRAAFGVYLAGIFLYRGVWHHRGGACGLADPGSWSAMRARDRMRGYWKFRVQKRKRGGAVEHRPAESHCDKLA